MALDHEGNVSMNIDPIVTPLLLAAVLVLLALVLRNISRSGTAGLAVRLDSLEKAQERVERELREEAARTREESGKAAREQRQELAGAFSTFGDTVGQRMSDAARLQKTQLDAFSAQLSDFAKASGDRLDAVRAESATGAKQLREEVVTTLNGIAETMARTLGELASAQQSQLEAMSAQLGKLTESNEKKLEAVRGTVEARLQSLQGDNAARLEQMRATVEEKLQGTLDKRLGESFKQVSERLEQVYKGLGEMQVLAAGVGDLKKMLTNVKTRGTWGEVQLGALLEQVLTPEQYAANVVTRTGGGPVEFAVRLPGAGTTRPRSSGCRSTRSSRSRTTSVSWRPRSGPIPTPRMQRPGSWRRGSGPARGTSARSTSTHRRRRTSASCFCPPRACSQRWSADPGWPTRSSARVVS